jgi:hypothetical protein
VLHGSRDKAVRDARKDTRREYLVAAEGRAAFSTYALGKISGGKVAFCVLQHAKLDGYTYSNAE